MAGPGYVTDPVVVPEQSLLLEVQIIAGRDGREVRVSEDLVVFSPTPGWMLDDDEVRLQDIHTVTSTEVTIVDGVVLVLLPARLHTLQLAHQPGLTVQISRLEISRLQQ